MTQLRITVLVENTAHGAGLLGEHGLAYWIEWDGHQVLFDTGQGFVLESNAQKLGIPFRSPDAIVLSHGHYDHTGGLGVLRPQETSAEVHVHPAAFAAKYARNPNGTSRSIGMPEASRELLRQLGNRVVASESPSTVFDRLMVTGSVPRTSGFEDTGGPFFLDAACSQPDPLDDDQSVFFDTPQGLVVVLGCAHSGVINTLRYVASLAGRPIHTVMGGMHLGGASAERIAQTEEAFRQLDVQCLAPCHCTGASATAALWNAFPGRCVPCCVGTQWEFTLTAPGGSA